MGILEEEGLQGSFSRSVLIMFEYWCRSLWGVSRQEHGGGVQLQALSPHSFHECIGSKYGVTPSKDRKQHASSFFRGLGVRGQHRRGFPSASASERKVCLV